MKKKYLDEVFTYVNIAFGLLVVGFFFWPALTAAGMILLMLSHQFGKMRRSVK